MLREVLLLLHENGNIKNAYTCIVPETAFNGKGSVESFTESCSAGRPTIQEDDDGAPGHCLINHSGEKMSGFSALRTTFLGSVR